MSITVMRAPAAPAEPLGEPVAKKMIRVPLVRPKLPEPSFKMPGKVSAGVMGSALVTVQVELALLENERPLGVLA